MRVVNKYYKEKLGQDARLNAQVLEFLGKCEAALTLINMHYNDLLVRDVRGEAGALRYAFTERNYKVKFTDKDKKVYEADVEPGVYEGYLLMGEKPGEAIKQAARISELLKIEEKDWTSAQDKELAELKVKRKLAKSFARANRYILEKETVDEKDIKEYCKENVKIILVGNKSDLEDIRKIKIEDGASFAAENGYMFMETSCLKNEYVSECFETLIELCYKENEVV